MVGGVDEATRRHVLSRQLEFIADSRALAQSLQGCLRHLVVDGVPLGWRRVAASRHVRPRCVWSYPCQGEPCPGNSRCVERGHDGYQCLCDESMDQQCDVEAKPPSVTVDGTVRVRELIVDEGGRRTITTEHVDIQVVVKTLHFLFLWYY